MDNREPETLKTGFFLNQAMKQRPKITVYDTDQFKPVIY